MYSSSNKRDGSRDDQINDSRVEPEEDDDKQEEEEENPFRQAGGPRVAPGTYTVAVTVNGKTETKTVTVAPDPRIPAPAAAFIAQMRGGLELRNAVSAGNSYEPGGTLYGANRSYTVASDGQLRSAAQYNDLILAYSSGAPVRLPIVSMSAA